MNRAIRFGLAAALVIGGASAAIAQDPETKATGSDVTGSVPAGEENFGQLISGLQTTTAPDLTAFADTSTVDCVKVSTLQGAEEASALDNAITQNQAQLTSLHGSIQGNQAFLDKVEASCAVAELDPTKILMVESEADGTYKVWFDDRTGAGADAGAAAAGAAGAAAGAADADTAAIAPKPAEGAAAGAAANPADGAADTAAMTPAPAEGEGVSDEVTGSIPPADEENFGQLISGLQTSTAPDLTAFAATSTVDCVKVSELQGAEEASALDNAITQNQDKLSTLHSGLQGNQAFLDQVQSSCAVAELDPTKILMIESDPTGYKVWIDDRMMAGGAMGTDAGAGATSGASTSSGAGGSSSSGSSSY
jgi:hypothetical protein